MELKQVIVGDNDMVPMLFELIEKELKRKRGTHIHVDKRFVEELKRMSDNEERNGSILFFENWKEDYHYYESTIDGKGILDHVEVYDENMQDIEKSIYSATFVANSTNYCQLVSYSSAAVRKYYHYEVPLNEILMINYIV